MKVLSSNLALFLCSQFLIAQPTVSYNDVAVIVNNNSQVSQDIGSYFQQKRDIPNKNIIHISAPTTEIIDSLEFEQIRDQVENYLTTQNIADSINYLVTTKGVPLKVDRGACDSLDGFEKCSSFDSELTLLLGTHSNKIGVSGPAGNPYYDKRESFDRSLFGIYLVTRLDGYTKEDVFNLITNSGPNQSVDKSSSKFLFDISSVTNAGELSHYTNVMEETIDSLNARGWNTTFHPDTSLLTDQSNVLGYVGVNYSRDNIELNNSWVKGSIGYLFTGFSSRTFDEANKPEDDLLAADLIAEGVSGAAGHTTFIYGMQAINNSILLNAYTDTNSNFNLAESYYMAMPDLSWQHVVVGDPKTSITLGKPNSIGQHAWEDEITLYPNPGEGIFKIESEIASLKSIEVYNVIGQSVYTDSAIDKHFYFLDLASQSNGTYVINLQTDKGTIQQKVVVTE